MDSRLINVALFRKPKMGGMVIGLGLHSLWPRSTSGVVAGYAKCELWRRNSSCDPL